MLGRAQAVEAGHPTGVLVLALSFCAVIGTAMATGTGSAGAAPEVVPACDQVGAVYPMLLNVTSNTSFFPGFPAFNGSNGTTGQANFSGGPPPMPGTNGTIPPMFPPLPNLTVGRVAQLFAQVCPLPEFVRLLGSVGVQNFSLGGGGNTRTGAIFVSFGFFWTDTCPSNGTWGSGECSYQEYWSANATSGAIQGPITQVGPSFSSKGPGGFEGTQPNQSPGVASNNGWWIASALWAVGGATVAGAVLWERRRWGQRGPLGTPRPK